MEMSSAGISGMFRAHLTKLKARNIYLEVQGGCNPTFTQANYAEGILSCHSLSTNWVAVKELNLSYYIAETILVTIYTVICPFL